MTNIIILVVKNPDTSNKNNFEGFEEEYVGKIVRKLTSYEEDDDGCEIKVIKYYMTDIHFNKVRHYRTFSKYFTDYDVHHMTYTISQFRDNEFDDVIYDDEDVGNINMELPDIFDESDNEDDEIKEYIKKNIDSFEEWKKKITSEEGMKEIEEILNLPDN